MVADHSTAGVHAPCRVSLKRQESDHPEPQVQDDRWRRHRRGTSKRQGANSFAPCLFCGRESGSIDAETLYAVVRSSRPRVGPKHRPEKSQRIALYAPADALLFVTHAWHLSPHAFGVSRGRYRDTQSWRQRQVAGGIAVAPISRLCNSLRRRHGESTYCREPGDALAAHPQLDDSALGRLVLFFVCGALVRAGSTSRFARSTNNVRFAGWPLGYYMASQGALIAFVIQLFVFVKQQDNIDRKFGVAEDD